MYCCLIVKFDYDAALLAILRLVNKFITSLNQVEWMSQGFPGGNNLNQQNIHFAPMGDIQQFDNAEGLANQPPPPFTFDQPILGEEKAVSISKARKRQYIRPGLMPCLKNRSKNQHQAHSLNDNRGAELQGPGFLKDRILYGYIPLTEQKNYLPIEWVPRKKANLKRVEPYNIINFKDNI